MSINCKEKRETTYKRQKIVVHEGKSAFAKRGLSVVGQLWLEEGRVNTYCKECKTPFLLKKMNIGSENKCKLRDIQNETID